MKQFFVMLNGGGGFPLPLVDEDDTPVLFSSREQAYKAAEDNCLGAARGYEAYPWMYKED